MKRSGRLKVYTQLRSKSQLKRGGKIQAKRNRKEERIGKFTKKIRLSGPKLTALRQKVYDRAGGICEVGRAGCGGFAGWDYGHMHHKQHRSLGGSDSLDNCAWSCPHCHREEHGVNRVNRQDGSVVLGGLALRNTSIAGRGDGED